MFSKIVKHIDKIVLFFAFFVLSVSFYHTYSLNIFYKKSELVKILDKGLLLAKNILEDDKRRAMSLSLLISQDMEFLKSFYADDRRAAFDTINKKAKILDTIEKYPLEVQVHDKKSNCYLRSWDYNLTNIPLASFRKGVVLVKETKKPLVSIEIGKRLNIKAISPILKNREFEGSVEVIEGFGHLREKLLEHGYIMFIILNKKFLPIATSLKNHQIIQNKFILVNEVYEKNSFNALKNSDLSMLGSYGYFSKEKFSFGYFAIKNLHNENIGYCIISPENIDSDYLKNYHQNSSVKHSTSGILIR